MWHSNTNLALIKDQWLMDEFDKFAAKEGESLDSVHERLTTLVNIDGFLMSNASSSHLHANSSYSPQSYYVTHPPSVVDYDDEYQGELQGDSQEDKLTTAMMLLARAISQKFSSPTNNRLRVSSNTKNQAVVQDGRVDIQTKNAGYGGIAIKNLGRNRNQMFHAGNASDESQRSHYARDCQKPKVHDAKYFREQMLLAMKDEAGSHLSNKENDFMLDNTYGKESLDELTASLMLMARL
ncbi:hypothetical protein Tco_0243279 [Tanacetum coccineum]